MKLDEGLQNISGCCMQWGAFISCMGSTTRYATPISDCSHHATPVAPTMPPRWLPPCHPGGSHHATPVAPTMPPRWFPPCHPGGSHHATPVAPTMPPRWLPPCHPSGSHHVTPVAPTMLPRWHPPCHPGGSHHVTPDNHFNAVVNAMYSTYLNSKRTKSGKDGGRPEDFPHEGWQVEKASHPFSVLPLERVQHCDVPFRPHLVGEEKPSYK